MDANLAICLDKHHEACEALMEHFYSKNDDAGLELLGEIIDYEFMAIRFLNDAYHERERLQRCQAQTNSR